MDSSSDIQVQKKNLNLSGQLKKKTQTIYYLSCLPKVVVMLIVPISLVCCFRNMLVLKIFYVQYIISILITIHQQSISSTTFRSLLLFLLFPIFNLVFFYHQLVSEPGFPCICSVFSSTFYNILLLLNNLKILS